jgi:uncharacterized protein YdeI (YjbR/CyaY-like superfamily)
MEQIHLTTRGEWRRWLAENHARVKDGIWLVFHKKATGKRCMDYEDAVEEALCFGWIDSLIKRIDDNSYCRKFTPRKDASVWSPTNKKRLEKIIKEGRITQFGLAKVEAAKTSGRWDRDPRRPMVSMDVPEWSAALKQNPKARDFFETLPPSHQKHYIGWIASGKRPETRAKRIKEALALLAKGQKLGLK